MQTYVLIKCPHLLNKILKRKETKSKFILTWNLFFSDKRFIVEREKFW